jgi:hypothetical protein
MKLTRVAREVAKPRLQKSLAEKSDGATIYICGSPRL